VARWSSVNVDPAAQAGGACDIGAGFPMGYVYQYYEPEAPSILDDIVALIVELFPLIFLAVIIMVMVRGAASLRRRMNSDYYEPKLNKVGAGPRRDLTAVEAAVVLERPLDQVARMILFGLVKKGKVTISSYTDPLTLRKLSEGGDHIYEDDFLGAISKSGLVSRDKLRDCLVALVNATRDKMAHFDCAATQRYYGRMCEQAWKQVEDAGTPDDMARLLDESNDWLMVDRGYDGRIGRAMGRYPFYGGPVVVPPVSGQGIASAADGYVNSLRAASERLVNDMRGITRDVVQVTNPIPVNHSGGGSGGGHYACACACACACAGGGR
jgi:hypothetical protein